MFSTDHNLKSVFVVHHLHTLPQDNEDLKMIGVYLTREEAVEATKRLELQPGFCDYPSIVNYDTDDDMQGFHIDEYEIGKDYWQEGFR